MPATNPVPAAADFCGLSGPEATELLAQTLANLANGTALEDCAVQARSVSLERGSIVGETAVITTTNSILQVINMGTVSYDSCLDFQSTIRLSFGIGVPTNTLANITLYLGSGCGGLMLAEISKEKALPTSVVQINGGIKLDQQICFPAGSPREVTICTDRVSSSGPGGTIDIASQDIAWTGSCGTV